MATSTAMPRHAKPITQRAKDFFYWRIYLRFAKVFRIFGPRYATATVRTQQIDLLVSSDIEQYRLDSYETKEPETLDWLEQNIRSDSVFFDVGANVGLYSLYAASLSNEAKVFSFEPEAQNFSHLCQNVFRNRFSNIVPCNIALTENLTFDYFHISTMVPGSAMHSLHAPTEQRHSGSGSLLRQGMLAISLDELVEKFSLSQPTLLKLDVDGIEVKILRGAKKCLANPTLRSILLELTNDEDGREIKQIIESSGFQAKTQGEIFTTGRGHSTYNVIYTR